MKIKRKAKKINSRQKGARGERELASIFTSFGFPARRGQQFAGGPDSPDIIVESLPSIHFECKWVERGNLYDWMSQAIRDAGNKYPVVCHKRNGQQWVAILPLNDYIHLLRNAQ